MVLHFNTHFSGLAGIYIDAISIRHFKAAIRSRKSPDASYVIPSNTCARLLIMLQKLSVRKAAGFDKIGSQLLCIAAPVVTRLINFSFSSESFNFQVVGRQLKFLFSMVTHVMLRICDQDLYYTSPF